MTWSLLLLALAVNVFFLGLVSYLIEQNRRQYERQAELYTQNLSRLIAGHLEADIGKIDVILQVLADAVEKQLAENKSSRTELNDLMALQVSRLPMLLGLRMADAQGTILYGNKIQPGSTSNIADRTYFLALKKEANPGLIISEPVLGRMVKKWIVILARRVSAPDGSFGGAVYAMMPVEYFNELFTSLDLGPHGSISLRDLNMALILRYPLPEEFNSLVGSRNISPELSQIVHEHPQGGSYHSAQAFDRIPRTYSYSLVANAKHYIVVGQADDDYLAGWRTQTQWILILAFLFPIGTGTGAVLFFRNWKTRTRNMRELAKQQKVLEASQAALLSESNRRRILFDQSPDGIVIIDQVTTGFVDFNHSAHTQLGYSREEFAKLTIEDLEAKETAAMTRAQIAEVVRNGRADFETLHRTKTGELRNIHVRAQTVLVDGQTIYQCIWRDISENRRMETQLQQAQRMEALGLLAGGTAHEFNNMLGIMMANCDLVKMDLPPEHPLQADLSEITQAGLHAKDIVQQILTFSRQQTEAYKFLSLRSTVLEAMEQIRRLLPATVDLQTEIPGDGPLISGNATQIHQVLTNIFMNAWHALPESRGRIALVMKCTVLGDNALTLHPSLKIGEYWKLSITDNGKGMDEATLARIFEPFFTTKSFGKGSGLGLAVVHGIMQAHKGAITVSSTPGKGSSFELYFPTRPEAVLPSGQTESSKAGSGNAQRILVVDDELALAKATSRILRRVGYQATEVYSGAEALQLLRDDPKAFDLVITDLTMPGMDGAALAKNLASEQPELPIILASGFAMQGGPIEELPTNIRGRLQKPYSPESLMRCLQELLGSNKP